MAAPEFPEMQDRLTAGLCPAPICGRTVPLGRLACPAHWANLPIALRRHIAHAWEHWADNPGEHRRWKTEAFRFWSTGTWQAEA